MNKRIVSLFLCIALTIIPVVSLSATETEGDSESKSTVTVTTETEPTETPTPTPTTEPSKSSKSSRSHSGEEEKPSPKEETGEEDTSSSSSKEESTVTPASTPAPSPTEDATNTLTPTPEATETPTPTPVAETSEASASMAETAETSTPTEKMEENETIPGVKSKLREPVRAPSDTTWQNDWNYTTSGSSIILSKYKGTSITDLVVPDYAIEGGVTYSNVKFASDASSMFIYHKEIETIDLSNVDTSNVTNMSYMFYGCVNLSSLNLSGIDTSNVTNMKGMFGVCENLSSLDVSGFDTSNVTDMSYMFGACYSILSLDVSRFDTSNVADMSYMFYYCENLSSLDVSRFDTSNVTDMSYMFHYCENLSSLDVSRFDTSNVTDMKSMFCYCTSLSSLDVSGFDTSNVTDMNYMFWSLYSLSSLDVSGFDTSNVTNMRSMFAGCENLSSLDLSSFDLSALDTSEYFLSGCSDLELIKTPKNLTNLVDLPGIFVEKDAVPIVEYTTLPQNLAVSKTLVRSFLSIDPTSKTIVVDDEFTITATVFPDTEPEKTITWSSDKPEIATVDNNGNVKGIAIGTATITAKTVNDLEATCVVKVIEGDIPVESISVNPTTKTILIDDEFIITATVLPIDATDRSVTWSSDKPAIATVDNTGRVKGIAEGIAVITATTSNNLPATCEVTVKKAPAPTYRLIVVDNRTSPPHPELVTASVTRLEGDRYLLINDSDGKTIRPWIKADSSLKYDSMVVYDMRLTDSRNGGNDMNDFGECTIRLALPSDMSNTTGTISLVTIKDGTIDKSLAYSVKEVDGVLCIIFTTPHFTDFAILYKKPAKKIIPPPKPEHHDTDSTTTVTTVQQYYEWPVANPNVNRVLDSIPKTGDISQ